jgi:hypothetical protein
MEDWFRYVATAQEELRAQFFEMTLTHATPKEFGLKVKGRWFYERARGSYLAAEQKAAYRKNDQKSFRLQTPKQRRLSKLDVARYMSAWLGMPDRVCLGGQKNFQNFMQRLKDEPPPPPDQAWFKRLIAIAVLYRAAEKKIRSLKFQAYGAQITAYVVSGLSHRTGGRVDFDKLWSKQTISPELEDLIADWAISLNEVMRRSAGQKNPSEWFKKADCWKDIREQLGESSDSAEVHYTGWPIIDQRTRKTQCSSNRFGAPHLKRQVLVVLFQWRQG